MKSHVLGAAAALLLLGAGCASAQQAGTFTMGLGLADVVPQNDTGTVAGRDSSVDSDIRPSLTLEYFVFDNIGIEILAATPFKHDVTLAGLGNVGEAQHLPPTLSLQYHFANDTRFTPFVGAGINYTAVLDTKAKGALAGQNLHFDDSWGLAAHAGIDVGLGENDAVRLDARYIDIDLDASLNGASIGTAKLDPMIYGISWIHRF